MKENEKSPTDWVDDICKTLISINKKLKLPWYKRVLFCIQTFIVRLSSRL